MRGLFCGTLTRAFLALAVIWSGAQALYAQEDTGQALDRLQEQIAASPERLDLLQALGNAAVLAGKFDMAVASFEKVLEKLEPDSQEAGDLYLRIGETYRRKGDGEAAIASLTRASQLLPDQPVVVGTLALVLDGFGKKEEAEKAYRSTLQLDPDNAVAMNNLAFLLSERGEDLDHAWGYARRAMELVPEDVEMIDTAGWVQWKRGQTDEAIALFAEALGKTPGNESYRRHLMLALEAKSSRSASMDELKALLGGALSPDSLGKVQELLQAVRSSIR
jgi:cytochrome c-type biogenesis protein CcmH/NrfG